ncbi:uncharacterized protein LOC131582766 [Poecile atricapillus]|uniref:uncharacterized protein LOC131582766 n=1 Tax=Poecile atricapillus TaxID=48891 RepID=UPI0027393A18|nr:uncharacterized protein LOC131582766 [Poecile atricapillus]
MALGASSHGELESLGSEGSRARSRRAPHSRNFPDTPAAGSAIFFLVPWGLSPGPLRERTLRAQPGLGGGAKEGPLPEGLRSPSPAGGQSLLSPSPAQAFPCRAAAAAGEAPLDTLPAPERGRAGVPGEPGRCPAVLLLRSALPSLPRRSGLGDAWKMVSAWWLLPGKILFQGHGVPGCPEPHPVTEIFYSIYWNIWKCSAGTTVHYLPHIR